MKILVDPALAPNGFGIAQQGGFLHALSGCCRQLVRYSPAGISDLSMFSQCVNCYERFGNGFSNTSIPIGVGVARVTAWIEAWTGIYRENLEVEIDEKTA